MSRTVELITSLFLIFEFSSARAKDARLSDYSEQTCLAIATDNPSYSTAIEQITSMPMVKEWIAQLGSQNQMTLGGSALDQTEFIEGNCYWSISLYEASPAQLRLWKIFRVDIQRKNIFILNDDGDYVLIVPAIPSK